MGLQKGLQKGLEMGLEMGLFAGDLQDLASRELFLERDWPLNSWYTVEPCRPYGTGKTTAHSQLKQTRLVPTRE